MCSTKAEQGTRTGIWFSFNGFAQIFGGLVAYGISISVQKHGAAVASWKIVFLAIGLLTATVGCIFLYFMPDNQLNARFLTPRERLLAIERIRKNQQGVGNKHFKMYQFKEALLDPMTWAFFAFALIADIPNGKKPQLLLDLYGTDNIRRHFKFLLATDRVVRLHARRVTTLRHPRRSSRNRLPDRMRLARRQIRPQNHARHDRNDHLHAGHALNRLPPTIQLQRPSSRLLPHSILANRLRRTAITAL